MRTSELPQCTLSSARGGLDAPNDCIVLVEATFRHEDEARVLEALKQVGQDAARHVRVFCVLDRAELTKVAGELGTGVEAAVEEELITSVQQVLRDAVDWLSSTLDPPVRSDRVHILVRLGADHRN